MHPIAIVDPSDRGRIVSGVNWTWEQLFEFLSCPVCTFKAERPLVVGARFRGDRRLKLECLDRSIVALDFDGGETIASVCERLKGLRAIVHTTASHTVDKPRLRAFVELDRAIAPEEWDARIKPWLRSFGTQDNNALDITRVTYAPMRTENYQCLNL